jgi:tRNA threonylcarbamoyl adenosine modification protein (Sua5/YciO/YrdC/YwlC family)
MAQVIPQSAALENLAQLENDLRKGGVVVLPIEGSYIYVADAFNVSAVEKIHNLRGDESGTACAVAIGKIETLSGISSSVIPEIELLAKNFWPGLLTLMVQPNPALTWDLGDSGELGEFAVRIPDSKVLQELAKNIGPLAYASAAHLNRGAAKDLSEVSAINNEVAFYIDGGKLDSAPPTTVLRAKVIGKPGLEVTRLGAISLDKLRELLPDLSLANEV